MCKPLDFENIDHKALLNRIISGDVALFLGSGFSLGAIGSFVNEETGLKSAIPTVQQLKETLCSEILYTEYEGETLKDICEDCQCDNNARYAKLMRDIFRVSAVQDFHKMYAAIEWKSIFTTNVDNIIENIYESHNKKICSIYSENPVSAERGALKYYKLHGDAIIAPERITFSTTDYILNASRKNDCRFEALNSALKTENFLFIGTSLSEEWDFDIKCQQADIYIVPNKTYFILKDYNEKLIKKIKRRFQNPILIQETAESFIYKVQEYMSTHSVKKKECLYEKWNLRQIKEENYDVKAYLRPDLYLGAEPTWEDIFSNHDVIWERTSKAIEDLKSQKYKCTLIVGKPVSGKTTMLYRLGAMLCETGVILEYTGDDFWEDLNKYLNGGGKDNESVILVDDANWILGRIDKIVGLIEDTNVSLIISVRQREYEKRQHLFDETIREKINIVTEISRLTKEDIGRYLDKLNEKSFLGQYSKEYNSSKKKATKDLEQEILGKGEDPLLKLAYKMKYGEQLDRRLDEISEHIINSNNYNVKRFVVLLYFLDVIGDTGVKLSLFLDLYPMDSNVLKEFVVDMKDLLISNINEKSWKNSNYSKITIHGRFAEIVKKAIKKIQHSELEEIVEDIFRRMDSAYHFKSRQSNTYQNYVLYTLLRSQNISELFRDSNSKIGKIEWKYISQLYENLHEYLGDYHLYWLHRGISEVKMKNYSSAQIHLEQARVTRQSYSYEIEHSFAMLYFEKAINSKDLSDGSRKELLEKALKIIRVQIGREENDAFSIHSFIVKTIQFYQNCNQEVPDALMHEMLEYYYQARKRFDLNQSIIRRNMLMCIYKYLLEHNKQYDYNLSITQEELTYVNRRMGKVEYNIIDLI